MRKHDDLIRQITGEMKAHHHERERADKAERELRDLSREFRRIKARLDEAEAELASLGRGE